MKNVMRSRTACSVYIQMKIKGLHCNQTSNYGFNMLHSFGMEWKKREKTNILMLRI